MMRLVIGYDGSSCSDAAIESLKQGGLPKAGAALVVTAAEAPRHVKAASHAPGGPEPEIVRASDTANRGISILRRVIPGWQISARAEVCDAAGELISVARDWKADLVLVGSHGRRGIQRLMLGSVAHRVVRDALCSVRVGRCHTSASGGSVPPRLLLAVDGSEGSNAALEMVKGRAWPVGTEVFVTAVVDTRVLLLSGECPMVEVPPLDSGECEGSFERKVVLDAASELRDAGLTARPAVIAGDPVQVLLEQAAEFNVDCIFVGASGLRRLEQILLGRIAARLADTAPCSVEVVRLMPRRVPARPGKAEADRQEP